MQVLPHTSSGYQAQQFRDGLGVWNSIAEYLLPVYVWAQLLMNMVVSGWEVILTGQFWSYLVLTVGWIGAIVAVWRHRLRLQWFAFFLLAAGTFLPMAWLKHFDHYHAWPMAMRAILAVLMGEVAVTCVISAMSPQELSAPRRQHPGSGSPLRL